MEAVRPIRSRRNLRWIAVGLLAICLGGLGAALLYSNLSNSQEVLLVKNTIFRDQVITADDLAVTAVVPAAGLEVIPAAMLDEVVGSTAQYDLVAGGLLSARHFGEPRVTPGMARVGLRLNAGRVPTATIPSGTPVLLVALASEDESAETSITGSVTGVASVLPDGATLLDVLVPAGRAEQVARLAANDQLVLVQVSG